MSNSEKIRELFRLFPKLTPRPIERLLAARGVEVSENHVNQVLFHEKRKKTAEKFLLEVLNKLFVQHPDPFPILQAALPEVLELLVGITIRSPGFSADEVASELAKQIFEIPLENTVTARWSMIYTRVLEQNPDLMRSVELVWGLRGTDRKFIQAPYGDGLESWTDEEIEAHIFADMRQRFPTGPTVEAIANAYFDGLRERQVQLEKQEAERKRELAEQQQAEKEAQALAQKRHVSNWDNLTEADWDQWTEDGERASEEQVYSPPTPEQTRAAEIMVAVHGVLSENDREITKAIKSWHDIFKLAEAIIAIKTADSDDTIRDLIVEMIRTRYDPEKGEKVELDFEGLTITSIDSPTQKP